MLHAPLPIDKNAAICNIRRRFNTPMGPCCSLAAKCCSRPFVCTSAANDNRIAFVTSVSTRSYDRLSPAWAAQRTCSRAAIIVAAAAATAGSAARSAAPADLDPAVYVDAAAQPQPFVGPISPVNIPGKGRGLVATQPLNPGQLLLVTPPVALIEGDLGDIPEHDELQEVISSSGALYSSWQADWLSALACSTDGTGSSSSSDDGNHSNSGGGCNQEQQQQQQQQVEGAYGAVQVPDMLPPEGHISWWGQGSSSAATTAAAGGGRVSFEGLRMDEERLWAAIVLNCYGEAFQDLPASLCSTAPISSQLGLWGPFALLNHSCCPNAVNYTLRDAMVVRATAAVSAGAELCINYLGRGALRPLSQRQMELEACYGFKCSCNRCQQEALSADLLTSNGSTLGDLLDQIQQDIGMVYEPQLQALLNASKNAADGSEQQQQQQQEPELLQLAEKMNQQWLQLQSAFNSSCNSSKHLAAGATASAAQAVGGQQQQQHLARAWAEASAFDLLGLLQEALSAAKQTDDAVLAAMLSICLQVCPGSDLHVFHALRYASIQQQRQGPESAEASVAFQGLVEALQLRYGEQVVGDEGLLGKMVDAATEAAAMVSF